MSEEKFEIEVDDTVAFSAEGEYGIIQGEAKVVKTFKNGKIRVSLGDKEYDTRVFYLLRKAV